MLSKNIIKTIGITAIFLTLLISLLSYYIKAYRLNKEHKYTVAIVTSSDVNARLGEDVLYTFSVLNKDYDIKEIIYLDIYGYTYKSIVGNCFLVKYQSSNPKNCKIMLDYRVKKGIVAPVNGWDSIP